MCKFVEIIALVKGHCASSTVCWGCWCQTPWRFGRLWEVEEGHFTRPLSNLDILVLGLAALCLSGNTHLIDPLQLTMSFWVRGPQESHGQQRHHHTVCLCIVRVVVPQRFPKPVWIQSWERRSGDQRAEAWSWSWWRPERILFPRPPSIPSEKVFGVGLEGPSASSDVGFVGLEAPVDEAYGCIWCI